eukprot:1160804-Pelagomonas_calceolata.AAC.21
MPMEPIHSGTVSSNAHLAAEQFRGHVMWTEQSTVKKSQQTGGLVTRIAVQRAKIGNNKCYISTFQSFVSGIPEDLVRAVCSGGNGSESPGIFCKACSIELLEHWYVRAESLGKKRACFAQAHIWRPASPTLVPRTANMSLLASMCRSSCIWGSCWPEKLVWIQATKNKAPHYPPKSHPAYLRIIKYSEAKVDRNHWRILRIMQ